MLFLTVLVIGIVWYAVGALGKAAPTRPEREIRTGEALRTAKLALLAYVALQAARSTENFPGRLPCPEHPSLAGTGNEGIAGPNAPLGFATCAGIGRLPWKTLGIDRIRDGFGEPLWYIVPTGTWALVNSSTTLTLNPGTADQFVVDGAAVATAVALIIAPGEPLNTTAAAPATAPCANVNQQVAGRNVAPLSPANFLECANTAAAGPYTSVSTAPWSNDRVITISAAEVMDAIGGAIADRLQRQVAPVLEEWRAGQSVASWGQSFLPHASTFGGGGGPSGNDLCGDLNMIEGMPPSATVTSGLCDTAWSSGGTGGLGVLLSSGGCTPGVSEMRCSFTVLLAGIAAPTITATAPRIAHSFRSFDPSQITIKVNGGGSQPGNVSGYSATVSSATGNGTISFQINFPLLSIADTVEVRIPNPSDFLLADARTQWFLNNGWDRFAYYAVSRASTINPMTSVCNAAGDPGCLTVNGMAAPADDKRLVLALMGRGVSAQTRPSASEIDYLEQQNVSTGDAVFDGVTVNSGFNDRVAACPFQLTPTSGPVAVCN